ncbi:MAG: SBBP repeat-containing protein, partial [Acidobacteriota bacterium]
MVGANANPRIEGLSPRSAKTNYFIGNDPRSWKTNTPSYGRIKYHEVFPGIDLEFYGNNQGTEYDYIVAPGSDPNKIKLEFKGADRIRIDAGELVLHTPMGELRQHKPVIYQEANGVRQNIEGGYSLQRSNVTFSIGRYDKTKPLVIDPAIVYSTFLGGSERTEITDIATYTDSATGNTYAYVTGQTRDTDFPTKNPFQANYSGRWSVFVTKLNMSAIGADSLVYSTYLGGNGNEHGYGIAVDSTGAAYLTGYTSATDFPLTNAFRTTTDGDDAYVTKVRPDGSGLVYSSYLGGFGGETAYCIAVDAAGNAYVGGSTSSTNLPVINAFRTAPAAGFISKIAPPSGTNTASLTYSSYIDGTPLGIVVDLSGNVYAAGTTNSFNLPTTANAFQPVNAGNGTGFIIKVNTLVAGPASLAYSTYFGGTYGSGDANPFASNGCQDIAIDSAGNAYVTGNALASDFPTTPNSLKPDFDDDADAFVAKLDTTKSGAASLVYSTLLGGHGGRSFADQAFGIAIDAAGNAYVVGIARTSDFPVVNSFQPRSTGVFVTANEGASFGALNKGLAYYNYKSLTIDTSTEPRTLYTIVSVDEGSPHDAILKSIDGGNNWNPITSLPPSSVINSLALDPHNKMTVYVGTDKGIFKSINGGNGWIANNNGLSYGADTYVKDFTFDSTATSQTIYVGTDDNLYKSNDGGNTWLPTGLNTGTSTIVINATTAPHTLFANLLRSTDGGDTWSPIAGFCDYVYDYRFPRILETDPTTTPTTVYANDPNGSFCGTGTFLKSTDNGTTWQDVSHEEDFLIPQLLIDGSTSPSTLYRQDTPLSGTGGIEKSTDGGISWVPIVRAVLSGPFTVDPISRTSTTPSTLYFAHGGVDTNAFVSQLNPTGSTLIFSTLLGGPGGGSGAFGVALDTQGNIYVAGGTDDSTYPTLNAFQPNPHNTLNGFITKLGSAALPSYSGTSVTTQVALQ